MSAACANWQHIHQEHTLAENLDALTKVAKAFLWAKMVRLTKLNNKEFV